MCEFVGLGVLEPEQVGKALANVWSIEGCSVVPITDKSGAPAECPITLSPLVHPVMLSDGVVYEEKPIKAWLLKNDTAPSTNLKLPKKQAVKLKPLKRVVESFLASTETPSKDACSEIEAVMRQVQDPSVDPDVAQVKLDRIIAAGQAQIQKIQERITAAQKLKPQLQQRTLAKTLHTYHRSYRAKCVILSLHKQSFAKMLHSFYQRYSSQKWVHALQEAAAEPCDEDDGGWEDWLDEQEDDEAEEPLGECFWAKDGGRRPSTASTAASALGRKEPSGWAAAASSTGGRSQEPPPPCVPPPPRSPPAIQEECPATGWEYVDLNGAVQGPFAVEKMLQWHGMGFFKSNLPMRCNAADRWVNFNELFPPPLQPFRSCPRRPVAMQGLPPPPPSRSRAPGLPAPTAGPGPSSWPPASWADRVGREQREQRAPPAPPPGAPPAMTAVGAGRAPGSGRSAAGAGCAPGAGRVPPAAPPKSAPPCDTGSLFASPSLPFFGSAGRG